MKKIFRALTPTICEKRLIEDDDASWLEKPGWFETTAEALDNYEAAETPPGSVVDGTKQGPRRSRKKASAVLQ